jgi:preprotein translocase subunit SecF
MSDSPFEEMEAREHAEHAEHAAHENNPLISQVTLTIAVMAVIAAVGASIETTEGDRTIVAKNEAVLEQNQATDAWNEYEAKSLKKNLYTIAADQPGPRAEGYAKIAAQNADDQKGIQKKAKAFEEARDKKSEEAEVHERRHGRLTIASTLLHMAIAIATLAIILQRRWPWFTAIALTAAGLSLGAWAYL